MDWCAANKFIITSSEDTITWGKEVKKNIMCSMSLYSLNKTINIFLEYIYKYNLEKESTNYLHGYPLCSSISFSTVYICVMCGLWFSMRIYSYVRGK